MTYPERMLKNPSKKNQELHNKTRWNNASGVALKSLPLLKTFSDNINFNSFMSLNVNLTPKLRFHLNV